MQFYLFSKILKDLEEKSRSMVILIIILSLSCIEKERIQTIHQSWKDTAPSQQQHERKASVDICSAKNNRGNRPLARHCHSLGFKVKVNFSIASHVIPEADATTMDAGRWQIKSIQRCYVCEYEAKQST